MPNWCYNEVTIDGFTSHLKEFADKAAANNEREDLSLLRAFIPMPEEFTTMEGYNNGGYEWACNTWGTKWAESSIDMTANRFGNTGQVIYQFESPWHPPIIGYDKISKMFPYLTFIHYWDEPGMCFCGIRVVIAGEQIMIEEVDQDYPGYNGDSETGEEDYSTEILKIRDYLFSEANKAIKSLK
jgi:hypothetical protein